MGRNILLHCLLSLLVLAHDVLAQSATTTTASSDTAAQTPNTGYNGGVDNPQDPSDAGAAGASKGAFSLSRGGLIAIIVVAVLVAVGGGKHQYSSHFQMTVVLTSCHSWLRCTLLACKEATMGRPAVDPSCLPPPYRSLRRLQAPEPTNWRAT